MFSELLKNVMSLGIITKEDVARTTGIELMLLIIERTNGLLNALSSYMQQNDTRVSGLDLKYQKITDDIKKRIIENETYFNEVIRDNLIDIGLEQLNAWVTDGTLETMINQTALKSVNDRITRITLNVADFGAKGDGVTDDADAIQSCLDFAKVINNNTTLPINCHKITFPYGVYGISKPIVMTTNSIIDFNNSQIIALTGMPYMWTFSSDIQLPGIIFNDMILHGKGMVDKGLWIKDVTRFTMNRIITFAFKTHHIYADKSGKSGQCHFVINSGEMLGGINPNAGGYNTTNNAIGLENRTTDCIVRDLITRDLNKHIVNSSGINFYDHCHGWNQYSDIMADSTHFVIGWDAKLINCYSDTVSNAFELKGEGRVEVIAHTCFTNKDFYKPTAHGKVRLIKLSKGDRVAKFIMVGSRLDANGVETSICDAESYAKYCEFVGCNSNYKSNGFVVNSTLTINKPSGVSAWSWNVKKLAYDHVQMIVHGDIDKETVNAKDHATKLFTMPSNCYNVYYATPITVLVRDYGNSNSCICTGEIDSEGNVTVNLKSVPFTAGSNCKYSIISDYLITF